MGKNDDDDDDDDDDDNKNIKIYSYIHQTACRRQKLNCTPRRSYSIVIR
jgi:hypothetical protein